ncbi:hypothetical protein Leryth_003647 [Lithospermum erythrorhizon]|nr:hypothetical protein Leryth_003647 [Lithospermum erythrorhizon]
MKMAGIFGAILPTHSYRYPNPCPILQKLLHPFPKFPTLYKKNNQIITMAEVQEPSPKIQKLDNLSGNVSLTSNTPFFRVKKLSENAVLPSRGSPLSAGYDLSSATETKVPARGKALVPTDLSIAVPEGTYARIAPRSGLAWKHSIDVGAGVIDADYRGPVGVILFNHGDVDFEVKIGDRIAQLIIEKIVVPEVEEITRTSSGTAILKARTKMADEDGDKQNMDIKRAELFNLVEAIKKCIPVLKVRRLSDKATLPKRVFPESAAYDLYSAEDAIVPARGKAKISLDLSIDIPPGTYGRIAPRSSKAWNNCIDIGGGVVDADKNPVFVILFNHSDVDYEVKVGVAIAQLVLELNATPQVVEVHQ